jgi:hypothetical protein
MRDTRRRSRLDGVGEVVLSYGDGRYLFVDERAKRVADRVGCAAPLGKRIFEVAPALRSTTFGRTLEQALTHSKPGRCCERMPHIFPGARLAAVIEPKQYAVRVRFWLSGVTVTPRGDAEEPRETRTG